jgi:hypothetical protein
MGQLARRQERPRRRVGASRAGDGRRVAPGAHAMATPDGVAVAVVEAIKAGAVVMWRTYADDMPDEAAAITVLALSDLHAAAGRAGAPWTLMLDEWAR